MNELDKFGKLIATDLRDSALNHYLDIESGSLCSNSAKLLHKELSSLSDTQRGLVRKLITNSIDAGIHDFLFAIGEKKSDIKVIIKEQNVTKASDGLQGEIFTEDGWFEKFSLHKENGI